MRAVAEERPVALSSEERRADIECGQMGHQLGQGFALVAREAFQPDEEVLIRQGGGCDEDAGFHTL
jgi:hypothetical protein